MLNIENDDLRKSLFVYYQFLRGNNPMRHELKKIGKAERHTFTGIFERTGYKTAYHHLNPIYSPTLLLTEIRDLNGKLIADHLWFNYTKSFLKLGQLLRGDIIQFDARVANYTKGYYLCQTNDYKLSYPTKIRLRHAVESPSRQSIPVDDHWALIGYIMLENIKFYREQGRTVDSFYTDAFKQWQTNSNNNIM